MRRLALLCLCIGLAGCNPQQARDIAEIKSKQDEILQRLAAIEEGQKKLQAPARAARAEEDFDKSYTIAVGGSPVRGKADAPVTIVEFSDFQCPFCARSNPIVAGVLAKYPDKVNYVYKHFPLAFHAAARPAAIASIAAQEQGKFWEMHEVLFANQATLDASKLEDYAKQAGLDLARFKKDLESKKAEYEKRVDAEFALGQSVDVRGTPTLYIGGKKVRVRTVEGMSAMVDEQLEQKGG
ncbi:MAG: thioredoxin domain-containing protein [Myxococcota bacterium]